MNADSRLVLTLNSGSSGIKFALYADPGFGRVKVKGELRGIGTRTPMLSVQAVDIGETYTHTLAAPDHDTAAARLVDWLLESGVEGDLVAVGHRIVHGGERHHQPRALSPALIEELRRLLPLDPLHMPAALSLAEAFFRRFAHVPQIACFDTAFHHHLPPVARWMGLPRRYRALGVRRYGFHGLSYEYLMGELSRIEGERTAGGRVILAHLGQGASLAAVRGGLPIDTSMGFTPASGVMMGTRSGDVDPGLVGFLGRVADMQPEDFDALANRESGLLGVSETSADMRDLLQCEATDERAAEAIAMFCYQVRKCIGAFAAALGGIDALVFAGGVGENAPSIRARICEGLGFLGIAIDPARNLTNAGLVSREAGRVRVRVMHTDEEMVIARSAARFVRQHGLARDEAP
ncbi:MAG: acetate/propionate family kinase [Burkholderiales bacterium]